MIYKDISKKIEELRKKLHYEIDHKGIKSKETLKVSEELDELIKKFYIEKNNI